MIEMNSLGRGWEWARGKDEGELKYVSIYSIMTYIAMTGSSTVVFRRALTSSQELLAQY